MEIVKIENLLPEKIVKILSGGGIVVFPTDTVYGILGNATSGEVVSKIFALKKRSTGKAFPIFVKNITEARKFAYISDAKAKFLERVWPGPITAVFNHKEKLPTILTGGMDTVGMRIPDHTLLLDILSRLDFPLLQTSANLSGLAPAKTAKEAEDYFKDSEMKPDLVVDGGEIAGSASAVVDFTETIPRVLRTGIISKEKLEQLMRSLDQ